MASSLNLKAGPRSRLFPSFRFKMVLSRTDKTAGNQKSRDDKKLLIFQTGKSDFFPALNSSPLYKTLSRKSPDGGAVNLAGALVGNLSIL